MSPKGRVLSARSAIAESSESEARDIVFACSESHICRPAKGITAAVNIAVEIRLRGEQYRRRGPGQR
jgi:hypothetical protein